MLISNIKFKIVLLNKEVQLLADRSPECLSKISFVLTLITVPFIYLFIYLGLVRWKNMKFPQIPLKCVNGKTASS